MKPTLRQMIMDSRDAMGLDKDGYRRVKREPDE